MVVGRFAGDLIHTVAVQTVGTDANGVRPILLGFLRGRISQQAGNKRDKIAH
jgi:hypothetical protein